MELTPDPFDSSQEIADEINRGLNVRDKARKRLTLSDEKLFDLAYQYTVLLDYLVANQKLKPNGLGERISSSEISQAALGLPINKMSNRRLFT